MYYYAVANHGTQGLGHSYGYAYVREWSERELSSDQTTTVWGPYLTLAEAEAEVEIMQEKCEEFERTQTAW